MALGLALAACGGGSSAADTTAVPAAERSTVTTGEAASTENMNGNELADAVFAAWAEGMQKLDAMLADRPDPVAVQTEVEKLKEEYIQRLVALGRQVAALDLGEKAQMQAALLSAVMHANDEDWYASYSEIYADYAGSDMDFGNLVADFNILTQYADFDLLKQQAPDEAARLGIE